MRRTFLFRMLLMPAFALGLAACNLQQEVDIDLPEYEPQTVVECYLQPGQPYLLILTESSGFFEDIRIRYVRGAQITIRNGSNTVTLQPAEFGINTPGIGQLLDTALLRRLVPIFGESIYLYTSFLPVPADYASDFELKATLPDGRTLSALTRILPPVSGLEQEVKFGSSGEALVLTKFQDDAGTANFYRRVLELRRTEIRQNSQGQPDTVLVVRSEQDFVVDDDISNGQQITFGTGFFYDPGDTLVGTIYHITSDYYQYINTRDAAIAANLNPFSQPATVYSNIQGGKGIFTGMTLVRDTAIVQR
ncbi:MAG: DUF4249 domain-containing protein [Bacteroidia bacterium]|nr:DUF4249 domain-containing protein [Bacteroidia bacterium]